MKIFWGIVIVVIIAALALIIFSPKPSEDLEQATVIENQTDESTMSEGETVEVANSQIDFSFTGFGPGKSHEGTFESYSVTDVTVDENGIPQSGTITFEVESMKTDTAILDGAEGHLCAENFFDCANYKQIMFSITNVSVESETEATVTGDLVIKDTVKSISFPVTLTDNSASAEFRLNVADFGFAAPGIVDEEVEVRFTATR